jgi:hypothetical protein
MPAAPDRQLARLRARFRKHAAALAPEDFVLKGSLMQRYLPCGTPSCRCHADPAQWHGPYWQWSTRVRGKTVTRMLTPGQAQRYQQWMKNGQRLEKLLTEMYDISVRAAGLLSPKREAATRPKPSPRRTPPRKSTP